MKRYYVETNAGCMVIFEDGGRAVVVADVESKQEAMEMDYSGIQWCETLEEVCVNLGKDEDTDIFDFPAPEFELIDLMPWTGDRIY